MANKLKGVRMSTAPTFVVEDQGTDKFSAGVISDMFDYPALINLYDDMELYLERRGQYGPSEEDFGNVMRMLFPKGLMLLSQRDWVRYGLLHQIVSKLVRYCNNFPAESHPDSLRDMRVYAAMLQARDERV